MDGLVDPALFYLAQNFGTSTDAQCDEVVTLSYLGPGELEAYKIPSCLQLGGMGRA